MNMQLHRYQNGQKCCHESCSFSFSVQNTKIVCRLELYPIQMWKSTPLPRLPNWFRGGAPEIGRGMNGDEKGKEEERGRGRKE